MPIYQTSENSIKLIKLIVDNGLCASNSEAKRLIMQNAVTANGEKISDIEAELDIVDEMVIKVGKRKFLQIKKG